MSKKLPIEMGGEVFAELAAELDRLAKLAEKCSVSLELNKQTFRCDGMATLVESIDRLTKNYGRLLGQVNVSQAALPLLREKIEQERNAVTLRRSPVEDIATRYVANHSKTPQSKAKVSPAKPSQSPTKRRKPSSG